MKISIKAGTTSKLLNLFIQDSSSTTGAGLGSLVYNSAGLTAYYYREGAGSAVAITLATMTLGTWATGGFVVIDGTNMLGMYQLSIPDAAIASGAKSVVVYLKGVTNMAPLVLEIELTAIDNQDAVRGGMTALPNANAGANGGLPLGDASGRVDIGKLLGTAWLTPGTAGTPDVNVKLMNGQTVSAAAGVTFPSSVASPTNITAGTISTVTNLTNAPTAGDFTATMKTSIGTAVAASAVASVTGNVGGSVASVVGLTASNLDATISSRASATNLATTNTTVNAIAGYVDTEIADIQSRLPAALVSGRMDVSVGAMASNVITNTALASSAVDEIVDQVWDETISGHAGVGSTGAALSAAGGSGDPWSTALPGAYTAGQAGYAVGTYLNASVAAVKAKTDNLPSDPADASDIAAAFSTVNGKLDTIDDFIDTEVAAIKAKTDLIPASPAAVSDIPTAVQNADALLGRNVSGGSSSGRTVKQAFHFIRNKWVVGSGTLTVYDVDDTTTSWTGAVASTPGADPITGLDP